LTPSGGSAWPIYPIIGSGSRARHTRVFDHHFSLPSAAPEQEGRICDSCSLTVISYVGKWLANGSAPFYRATLCVSAVFAIARCPSVYLSHSCNVSRQTAEDIVRLLSRPGSPIILVFDPERRYPKGQFQGERRGRKIYGRGKMRFSTEIAVISEMVAGGLRDRHMVAKADLGGQGVIYQVYK